MDEFGLIDCTSKNGVHIIEELPLNEAAVVARMNPDKIRQAVKEKKVFGYLVKNPLFRYESLVINLNSLRAFITT